MYESQVCYVAVQAVSRALQLVELIARSPQPRGLMELAGEAQLDKSTSMRLLSTLVERGWVLRDQDTKRYSAGPTLVGMSMIAGLPDRLHLIAYPLVASLRDKTGETVSLQRRFQDVRVCVTGLESQAPVRRGLPLGMPLPLSAGPSGKAILAFVSGDSYRAATRDLSPDARTGLEEDLSAIRDAGFLSTDGDRTPDVAAVSVPLFSGESVYGSLTVAGPSSRFTSENRLQAVGPLLAAAKDLTQALAGDVSLFDRWRAQIDTTNDSRSNAL